MVGSPCTIADVLPLSPDNEAHVGVLHASGGVTDEDGYLRLVASVYKTQCDLDHALPFVYGLCPADGEEPEVSVVIRDHGPPTDHLYLQMTDFSDPSCSFAGGNNVCADSGYVSFGQTSGTNDIGRFFPTGCIEDDPSAGWPYCGEEEDEIQLELGQGNQAMLIRTGEDHYQVVAEINAPMV